MKISKKKFVIGFLLVAFAFQFATNSILGAEPGLFPKDGDWYPGVESPIGWKNKLAAIIYPVKYVLIEPLSFLGKEKDGAPPVLVLAFAIYWTAIALLLYFLIGLFFKPGKK